MDNFIVLFPGWFLLGAVLIFIGKTALDAVSYSRLPAHLRWDLYPVPHQGPAGSKYQNISNQPHLISPIHSFIYEMKGMAPEMLWIKRLKDSNPTMWHWSLLMHGGIFLSIAWIILVACGAVLIMNGYTINLSEYGAAGAGLYYLTQLCGIGGSVIGLIGSLGLWQRRLNDPGLRTMSDFLSHVNLFIMVLVFLSMIVACGTVDPDFTLARAQLAGITANQITTGASWVVSLEFLIWGVFILYLPFSRMAHYLAKYFMFHKALWEDEAMKPGSGLEKSVNASLKYRLSWTADHITPGKTWSEQVDGQGGDNHE